jgi:hypothetical protein
MRHSRHRWPTPFWPLLALVLLPLVALTSQGQGIAGPLFDAPPQSDTAGFFILSWSGAESVEIEQASGPGHADARIIYRGRDTSTSLSGLPDGQYRFRIRAEGDADWSDEAIVSVEHHPLGRAFLFFGLGAVVFLVLILFITRGRRLA